MSMQISVKSIAEMSRQQSGDVTWVNNSPIVTEAGRAVSLKYDEIAVGIDGDKIIVAFMWLGIPVSSMTEVCQPGQILRIAGIEGKLGFKVS